MELALALIAILVILAYWGGMLLAVWVGWRIAMKVAQRHFGTTDLLDIHDQITYYIRWGSKRP